jgi:hypothetical protein
VLNAAERPTWREEYGGRWGVELGMLALLLIVASIVAPLDDPDLPLHLAIGEWIVRHGTVPAIEPFAWTRAGEPYYAYSWLPQAVMYHTYEAAGVTGLRVLQGVAWLCIATSIFVLARLAQWSIWTAIVLAGVQVLLAMMAAPYLRPHMVLLIAMPLVWGCAIRLLQSAQQWRWASCVFLLSMAAANSHLLFPITAAPWLLLVIRWPGAKRAGWLIGATIAGWVISPHTLAWPKIFALNFSYNALLTFPSPISEFAPGIKAAVSGRGALLIIALLLALLPWAITSMSRRERTVWGAAWIAGLFAFALAARAIMVWWLLLLPLVAIVFEPLARVPRRRAVIVGQRVALLVLVLLLVAERARVSRDPWMADTGATRWLPTQSATTVDPLVRWLECRTRADAMGRAFTAFSLGSYLTWRHPALSYSIDTRTIFADSVAAAEGYNLAYRRTAPLGPWRSADLAIVPSYYPVASVLDTASGWHRAAAVAATPGKGDPVALWVTDRWWSTAGAQPLPRNPDNLPPGNAGVRAACMNGDHGLRIR